MFNIVAVQDSQFHRYADTVIGSQRSSLGTHPFSVNIRGDALLVEINLDIGQAITHHIHVALQNNRLAVLISRCCSLADNHVAHFVDFRL